MKRYLILVFSLLLSCEDDSNKELTLLETNGLIGSWKLVETYLDPGGGGIDWNTVDNGDIFKFDDDGKYRRTNTFENIFNSSGDYVFEEGLLELSYTNDGEEMEENFSVQMSEDTMVLSPAGPRFCIEACLYRYKRIN
ncbi:lipocalin family protein [Ulvibacterium sp.]|uniref:lipocalin family protein n=1 Tax=Ulvibacterium sp. TaxID=2665914 RepID=UPI00262F8910|nr:lipocalin family protein [Ulvibacterium sp.]